LLPEQTQREFLWKNFKGIMNKRIPQMLTGLKNSDQQNHLQCDFGKKSKRASKNNQQQLKHQK